MSQEQELDSYDLQDFCYRHYVSVEKYKIAHMIFLEEVPTEKTLAEYKEKLSDYEDANSSYSY
jgi:hypothetical protein